MSIYFIRHAGLVKIGYSSNLIERIGAIKASIPSPDVTFLGHMPGDRDVEAHLHQVFAAHRFTGEWFFYAPLLVEFVRMVLLPDLPSPQGRYACRKTRTRADQQVLSDVSQAMRQACAEKWPSFSHAERRLAAAESLGWSPRRARSVYEASKGCSLRHYEIEDLDRLSGAKALQTDARQIEPEKPQRVED